MAAETFETGQFNTLPDVDLAAPGVRDALDRLISIAEPVNGPNSFNLETAAYGYITRDERLVIPGGL